MSISKLGAERQKLPLLRADHCMDRFPGQLDDPGYHEVITLIDGKRVVIADTLNRDSRFSREDDERHIEELVRRCNSFASLSAMNEAMRAALVQSRDELVRYVDFQHKSNYREYASVTEAKIAVIDVALAMTGVTL